MSSQKGGAYNPKSKFYRFGGESSSSSSSSSTMDLIAKLDAKLGVKEKKKVKIKREPKGVKATIKDIPLYSATMRTQNTSGAVNNIGSITIPTTNQNVNPAQVGVFSAKSIPSKSSSNGGGGGSGGSGGGGGGGGRGFGGGGYGEANKKPKPSSKPKEQRKKQGEAQKRTNLVRAKVRAPQKTLGSVKRSSMAEQKKQTKPKRDITKITTPKPKEKVKSASGTIQKKVGGGKVKATEQTRPQPKSRIQGETTTTYGRKSKMRGERTTIK